MTAPARVTVENTAVRRVAVGAGLGLIGGLIALAAPALLANELLNAAGPIGARSITTDGSLVAIGAVALVGSFFFYGRGFAAWQDVDRSFRAATVLVAVGSLGALVLVVAAVVVVSSPSAIAACLAGDLTRALPCVYGASPLGRATTIAIFAGEMVGAAGLVLGLLRAARHLRSPWMAAGGVTYGAVLGTLLYLLVPGGTPFGPVPVSAGGTLAGLAVLAPIFVWAGDRRYRRVRR